AALRRLGLWGDRVHVAHSSAAGALAWQRKADLLLLPLSFGHSGADVIRTAAPGKMAEYLVSGVPILVHAPSDSYISQDAHRLGWGFVVDRSDARFIAEAIGRLLADDQLRQRLVANAFDVANARH